MKKKFGIKFAISGQLWTGLFPQKYKKCQFFGCLIKISIPVLNFSTESTIKLTNYELLFLTAIYSTKNDKLEVRN